VSRHPAYSVPNQSAQVVHMALQGVLDERGNISRDEGSQDLHVQEFAPSTRSTASFNSRKPTGLVR
jgi:hypothetical protein